MDYLSSSIRDLSMVSALLSATLIGLLAILYQYSKNQFTYWSKKGVKGPKPWPIVGNTLQLMLRDRMKLEREWARKYGKVYGIYQGRQPRLVVADAEVLQQICIKDFDAFTNKTTHEFYNSYMKLFLVYLKDEHWRRVRALMSPTFTSGKIKRMFRLLDACADDLVDCFNEQLRLQAEAGRADGKAQLNVKDVYSLFTMDGITTCCYGLKLKRVDGDSDLKTAATRNNFVRLAMRAYPHPLKLLCNAVLPEQLLRLVGFTTTSAKSYEDLATVVKQLVEQRRGKSAHKKYDDYLQLLIDAKLDPEMELNDMDLEENHHAGLTHESLRADQKKLAEQSAAPADHNWKQQVLSEMEIVSEAIFLLIAGHGTTASLLTNCTYFLGFNPEVQQKLYEEVRKIAEFKDDKTRTLFSYEALTSCRYLDAVLSETMRYFTDLTSVDRVAGRDYYIEKYGIHLPKGALVLNALHATMNDPDNWPEPQKFDPERFMPGNKEKIVPGSYCPFGLGPRHCLGMRFSLTEAKLALAKTVMKYKFEPAPGTTVPPVIKISAANSISIKRPHTVIVPRGDEPTLMQRTNYSPW